MRTRLAIAPLLVAACSRAPAPPSTRAAAPAPGPALSVEPLRCEDVPGDQASLLVELDCSDVRHSRMLRPRVAPLAYALPDGAVLVVGGDRGDGDGEAIVATAELYDPALARWVEVAPPPGLATDDRAPSLDLADEPAVRLVGAGDRVALVTAATGDDRVRVTVAHFDRARRAWSAAPPPIAPAAGRWVSHVAAAFLSDGALLVISADQAAILAGGRWRRLPELPGDAPLVTWIAALPGGRALVQAGLVLDREPRAAWRTVGAVSERATRGNYAVAVLDDHRVALVGGCSDGGECWGDSEIDVFDPTTGRYRVTPGVLQQEHSVAPAAVAVPRAGVLLTSDFAANRELERCTVPSDPDLAPPCRCGGCAVPTRARAAVVPAGDACVLVIGGDIPRDYTNPDPAIVTGPTADVLRLCWRDRPWTRPDPDDL